MRREFLSLERFINSSKKDFKIVEDPLGILITNHSLLISKGDIEVETKKEILKTCGYKVNFIEDSLDNFNNEEEMTVIHECCSFTEVLIFLKDNFN